MFTFGRLGVPIFLMISEYLLLDRQWNSERTVRFWKTNWLRLLICTEIWWIIYNVFLTFYYNKALSIVEIIQNLIFVKQIDLGHVWYMPMILGMYILISMVGISLQFSLGFSGGEYGLYLIFGYLIKKGVFKNLGQFIVKIAGLLAFAATIVFQLCSYALKHPYNVWYNNGFLMVSAVSLMIIFSNHFADCKPSKNISRFTNIIAKDSFGIYLLHMPIIKVAQNCINWPENYNAIKFITVNIIAFTTSWAIVEITCRIPKLGNITAEV